MKEPRSVADVAVAVAGTARTAPARTPPCPRMGRRGQGTARASGETAGPGRRKAAGLGRTA